MPSCLRAAALLVCALAFTNAGGCARPRTAAPPAADWERTPEAYARATGALMGPGASRAFLVTPDGSLTNGDWRVVVSVGAPGTAPPPPRAIAAEERWLPVLHWVRHDGAVRYEFEAVAQPAGADRDTGLFVSLEVRAINTGSTPAQARIALSLTSGPNSREFVTPDAPEVPPAPRWAGADPDARAHAWADSAGAAGAPDHEWTLAPGGSELVRYVLPAYEEPQSRLANWARTPHERLAQASREYWRATLARGTRFSLSDPEVERALSAAEVVLLSCREKRGAAWVPIGNPFQYRDVWVRDGARAIRALAVAGFLEEARGLTDGLMLTRWPNGAFLSQRGQLDGTGQALWAFDQALSRGSRDDARIASTAEAAALACGWLDQQRAYGAAAGWPFGEQLPFGDPRDAELVRAQLTGNDAWGIAGYRAASRLLRAAGRVAEADSCERALVVYRAAFVRDLEQTSSSDIPPSWQGGGRDWGNLSVAIPCRVLSLEHPRVAAQAERVWREAGGPGLGYYGERDSIHTYIAADIATWAALTGRGNEADRMLDSLLHWRTASGGAGEFFSRVTRDFGNNLPPHTTAAAAFVSLVRDMLLDDDGDTLRLTSRARPAWWKAGEVRNAPTRFGVVSLRFTRAGDRATWRWSAVPVWTALTTPPGTRAALPLPSNCRATARPDLVLVPPGTASLTLALAPRGGGS